jgi:hypothetical protein
MGVSLYIFAKLELGFLGVGAFFRQFSQRIFVRFSARPNLAFWRLRLVKRNDEPMRGLKA